MKHLFSSGHGLFRPLAWLAAGALALLLASSLVLVWQMEDETRDRQAEQVAQGWQATTQRFAAVALALGHQPGAARHMGDARWAEAAIIAPLRASTGARTIALTRTAPHQGLALPLGGGWWAAVPLDAGVLEQFARQYDLQGLSIAENGAHLAWHSVDPLAGLRQRLPAILTFFASLFALALCAFLRQSRSITGHLIAKEAHARHLAFHDTLTGLPNRAMMIDRLGQMLAHARRYNTGTAVHCLDLDRFKEVNDLLGHAAGDELIQQVAQRIGTLLRDSDTVARLGGDEFVILQPETHAAGASHLAARVLQLFEEPFTLAAGTAEVGISIGITLIADAEIEASEALRQADLALYGSKEGGRNRATFFEPDMDAALRMRRSLEADLRKALAEGELEMVYQPQIDNCGRVATLEALVRWNHPTRGAIAPSVFVPLCEETGLILELGDYIFRRVFAESRDWVGLRVAINVSTLQLRSPMFMGNLTRLVAEYRVDPTRYEIEITEAALLGNDGAMRNNIVMLKQEGFSIALDDFGTGYSSLNLLKQFAVDKIKIDRSFVHNLEASDEAEGLVDAIVKLGRALKLDIVAEGVETEAQRARLAACGCNNFQGWLVSKPVAADQLDGLHFG